MSVLRLQLEILSHFSYSDPEVLLQELSAAVAYAESPPSKQPITNPEQILPQGGRYTGSANTSPHSSSIMVNGQSYGCGVAQHETP